ncbi:MAG: quinolinate synthase NadA [Planctomycetes bacterium]|nr:quinolinate synthase NadA [Planctomycetota bacterium]
MARRLLRAPARAHEDPLPGLRATGYRGSVLHTSAPRSSGIVLEPELPICQTDLPLDWYQEEFRPYAEEYLALPDRTPGSVLPWLDRYALPAREHFGDSLLLLAHFYMGGEIVKLVERYGGTIADSYVLALQAARNPEKRVIVESAVHFMAETIAILSGEHQSVWITNPKAGCTMEMLAKEWMVAPAAEQLVARYGDRLAVVAYMNTGGALKALAGRTGGAVCTSSNAHKVVARVRAEGKQVLFVPDHHLGRNTAWKLGIPLERVVQLAEPRAWAAGLKLSDGCVPGGLAALDRAEMILWGSSCGVHTVFRKEHVAWWRARGWQVLVHPESPLEVVQAADGAGSTDFLWRAIAAAPPGARLAIGTEGHFVRNARQQALRRGVQVVHLTEIPEPGFPAAGCGCATMSRNDPPHLAGMLDLLRRGAAPDLNRVLAGDVVDEVSGRRERLDDAERATLIADARRALERMIEITESSA